MGPASAGSVHAPPVVAVIVTTRAQGREITTETAHAHTPGTVSMSATAARGNVAPLSVPVPRGNVTTSAPTAGNESMTGHARGTGSARETERGKALDSGVCVLRKGFSILIEEEGLRE